MWRSSKYQLSRRAFVLTALILKVKHGTRFVLTLLIVKVKCSTRDASIYFKVKEISPPEMRDKQIHVNGKCVSSSLELLGISWLVGFGGRHVERREVSHVAEQA
jgi:hypothetical protein